MRVDRHSVRFDGFDYSEIGGDEHMEDFLEKAEADGIITADYRIMIMRDLRVARHGNAFYNDW